MKNIIVIEGLYLMIPTLQLWPDMCLIIMIFHTVAHKRSFFSSNIYFCQFIAFSPVLESCSDSLRCLGPCNECNCKCIIQRIICIIFHFKTLHLHCIYMCTHVYVCIVFICVHIVYYTCICLDISPVNISMAEPIALPEPHQLDVFLAWI